MTVFGWDASDYDHGRGPMDLASARAAGISFFTHKATEGTSTKHNPGASLAAARSAGIPFIGAYHVPRSGPSVSAQVDYLLSWMQQQAPWWSTFPGWFWQVDTEKWSYDQVSAQRGHDVAQELKRRTGKTVLHYAPEWAYGNSVPAGEPLWASQYVSATGDFKKIYPGDSSSLWHAYSGRVPALLQYSSSATIGRQPTCDANAFRGTEADFATMIGATHVTEDRPMFLAAQGSNLYLCDGMRSRPITQGHLADLQTLIDEKLVAPVASMSSPRQGWFEEAFGKLDPVPATAVGPSDAQMQAQAEAIAQALIESNSNGLTAADHTAIVADVQAALNTLHAG